MTDIKKLPLILLLGGLLCQVPLAYSATIQDDFSTDNYIQVTDGSERYSGELRKITQDNTLELYADKIDVGNDSSLDITDAITMAFWMRPISYATGRPLIDKYYDTGRSYLLAMSGTTEIKLSLGNTAGSAEQTLSTSSGWGGTAGETCFVTVTWDKSDGKAYYYKNGELISSGGSATADVYHNTQELKIGENYAGTVWYYGDMWNVMLLDRQITAQEVRNLYQTGDLENTDEQISFWKIDEGTGTSIADSWGSNTGTLTGGEWATETTASKRSQTISTDLVTGLGATSIDEFKYTTSKKGGGASGRLAFSDDGSTWVNSNGDSVDIDQCYSFDGVNDYIDLGVGTDIVSTYPISISMRFKSNVAEDWFPISMSSPDFEVWYDTSADRIYFDGSAADLKYVTWNHDTEWHTLTITDSGSVAVIYIDGVERAQSNTAGSLSSQSHLEISGRDEGTAYQFDGLVADVQVYDAVLTASEAWNIHSKSQPRSTNQVSRWKLDGNTLDSWGSNDATNYGATVVTGWENCPPKGNATNERTVQEFDGVNDAIDFGSSTGDVGTNDFSLFAWIKTDDLGTNRRIFSKDGADPRYYIRVQNDGTLFFLIDDAITRVNSYSGNIVVDDGKWHYVGFTFDRNGNATGYVDGVVDNTYSIAGAPLSLSSSNTFYIGRSTAGTGWFNGQVANAAIWDDVRTASEIQADFQNGYIDTTDANLVSYWSMDGDFLDYKGSNDGTNYGSTEINSIDAPITEEAQQTIDITGLGFTDSTYVKTQFYSAETNKTFALTEYSLEYTAGGGVSGGVRWVTWWR